MRHSHMERDFLSDFQVLYSYVNADIAFYIQIFSTTPNCVTCATTCDVPTPQACHVMPSVIRSDLIYVVFSLVPSNKL